LPLAPDALLSAVVQALVASVPHASASSTKTADKIRDTFISSLLMDARFAGPRVG